MSWPLVLTTDDDVKSIVWLPKLDQMKDPSDSFDGLHEAASDRVRQLYQQKYGNPEQESEPLRFKRVAAFMFASTLFSQRDGQLSRQYYGTAMAEFRSIEADNSIAGNEKDSGPNAEVYLDNPGVKTFSNQDANSSFYKSPGAGPGRF